MSWKPNPAFNSARALFTSPHNLRTEQLAPLTFRLSETCKLVVRGGDITKWSVDGVNDAIVNSANEAMLGGGGVDGAIHDAAGPKLLKFCREELPRYETRVRCPKGQAVLTPGFNLPVPKIIHAVGPMYEASMADESRCMLDLAYRSSLRLARSEGVKFIAFPAISCGIFRYPAQEGAEVALKACQEESAGFSEIHFVLFEVDMFEMWVDAAAKAAKLQGLQ